MSRLFIRSAVVSLLLLIPLVQARTNFLAADATSPVAEDIPYRAALFHHRAGQSEKGLVVLSAASRATASAQVLAYRDMLAGVMHLALGHHEDAERVLTSLNDPQLFSSYVAQVIFPLAKTYYAQSRCDRALATLDRAQGFPPEVNAQAMFLKASCLLGQSQDSAVISQAESVITDALMTKSEVDNMWFAYAYFNVATAAAGKFGNYIEADRLYNEVLKYIDASEEGKALEERTLLSLGVANYSDNRFDYAGQYFARMPVDGMWADISLLLYGLAALNSYKPDIAIEAWRQLVNLPYRSMSVYDGYMAIPSAFEKGNAYADALSAYEEALAEFSTAIKEIEQTSKSLTVQKVHDYALVYGQEDATSVAGVPPLLARTYTEDGQRYLVAQINDIETYKKRLAEYEQVLQQIRSTGGNVTAAQQNIAALRQQANRLQAAMEADLHSRILAVLDVQKKQIMKYTLDARITNVRLQEEFFQRGGRRLWR